MVTLFQIKITCSSLLHVKTETDHFQTSRHVAFFTSLYPATTRRGSQL